MVDHPERGGKTVTYELGEDKKLGHGSSPYDIILLSIRLAIDQ